jgi:hypothetical protein
MFTTYRAFVGFASLAAATLLAAAPTTQARAQTAEAASAPAACGGDLDDQIQAIWQEMGGAGGRLGCPTTKESASDRSPAGSASRVAVFGLNGEIVVTGSGPRAGQAFAVTGCAFRLYTQFGGPGGWLGLPTGEPENTPDGARQSFEGGVIRASRSYGDCEATPTPPPQVAQPPAADDLVDLQLFENPATGDRLSLTEKFNIDEALGEGYQRLRAQARVLKAPLEGSTPLKLFVNEAAGLRETAAAPQSEREALAGGYVFESGEGFVWTLPRPGAIALKLWRQPESGRTRLTAGADDEAQAAAAGFRLLRIEGYAEPAPAP